MLFSAGLVHLVQKETDIETQKCTVYGLFVQVNLFQKHSFLNQLTHNMTTDCSLITDFSTRKIQVENMLCTKIVLNAKTKNNFCTQHVL